MNSKSAFIPHCPLGASSFGASTSAARTSSRTMPRRRDPQNVRQMRAAMDGAPNFEEIAEQLSAELKKRREQEDGQVEVSSTDAPSGEKFIEITKGNNDMPKVILSHPPSSQQAEIYLYGAAVTSWTTRGENHFWMSDTNKWQPGGKAIRGGIPICFPQFGPYGDLVQHGFARISDWEIRDTFVADDSSVTAVFGLSSESAGEKAADWPYKFDAEYSVTLSAIGMETKLAVKNTDDKPIQFTCAFHNYFRVTSVDNSRVFGFEKSPFLDRLKGDAESPAEDDSGAGFLITEETDRIYRETPEELAMFDFGSMKVLKLKKTPTLSDSTLWNPYGADGADPGWSSFVCIEPACITNPATVEPGQTWVGAQLVGVE